MAKSAVFGVMHPGIAFSVSYALTGDLAIAGAITLVEPLVNTMAPLLLRPLVGAPTAAVALARLVGTARGGGGRQMSPPRKIDTFAA